MVRTSEVAPCRPRPSKPPLQHPIELAAAPPFSLKVKVQVEAIVIPESEGTYSVIIPSSPGCCTQGDSLEEVASSIVEAAECWLETVHDARLAQALKDADADL
jgi:predicted RNase H-like HicB family nuclease